MSLIWSGRERPKVYRPVERPERRHWPPVPEPPKHGWLGDLALVVILTAGMVCVLWWLL